MKKIMTAVMAVVVACAFSMPAIGGGACCGASAKADVKEAGKAGMECKVDAKAKASCVACEGCKKSGTVCEKCAAKCQVLSIKDGKATCCGCEKGCKNCSVKEGETKCSCGKAVKTCDLKGKFVCAHCKTIADKTGKCGCGADLQEVK